MALDFARLAQKAEENTLSGNRWKVKKAPAQNFIRVFKFTHKVTAEDVKAGLFTKEKLGKTVEEFDRGLTLQYGFTEKKRPIIATKETLARYNALNDSSNKANQESAKAIKPSKKFLMNIVDMDEKPRKMRHWACPSTAYNDILALIMNKEFGEGILGSKGRDLIISHDPSKSPAEQYKVQLRDQSKSVAMAPELQAKVLDFFSVAGIKEVGLAVKAEAPVVEEAPEETEAAEEEVQVEEAAESTEEGTEEAGTVDAEVGEEAGEAGEEGAEEVTEEETPAEEEVEEEPEKPAKKAAAPAKKVIKKVAKK